MHDEDPISADGTGGHNRDVALRCILVERSGFHSRLSPMVKASRTAQTIVGRWFIGGAERNFVPLSGPVIPVSRDEELAITADAERAVEQLQGRMSQLLTWTMILAGGTPWLGFELGRRYGWFTSLPTGTGAIGALCLAGVAILWIVLHHERAQFDLRDAIALGLRERRHLSVPAPDPGLVDLRQLLTIVCVLLGAALLGVVASGLIGMAKLALVSAPLLRGLAGVAAGVGGGVVLFVGFWLFRLRRSAAPEDWAD
jgi:hypothetical protein